MTDRSPSLNSSRFTWHIGNSLAAGLLILAGVVFQLAQFGYDGLAGKYLWFIPMVAANFWNFLAERSNLPALGELLRFWPMLLVAIGIALLALPYSACARLSSSQPRFTDLD